jgi:RNA polymerase sigma-70 factor (ECF subfamily)
MRDDNLVETAMPDWDTLVDEHGPLVLRISWQILGNRADVEDNLQDVFLQAVTVQRRGQVRHWRGLLRRLATFGALNLLRRRRNHLPLERITAVDPGEAPDQVASRRELQMQLRRALARLPDREGAVFSLRYFEGMTLGAIADSLDISYAAAGTALSRARSKLESILCRPNKEDP